MTTDDTTQDRHDDSYTDETTPVLNFSIEYDDEPVTATAIDIEETVVDDATNAENTESTAIDEITASTEASADTTDTDSTGIDSNTDDAISELQADLAAAPREDDGLGPVKDEEDADAELEESTSDAVFRAYPLLACKDVTYTQSHRDIWHDIQLDCYAGHLYGILVNADDDTAHATLTGLLTGFLMPTSGSVVTKTTPLIDIEPLQLRGHRIGAIMQHNALRNDLSALENITTAMEGSGRNFLRPIPTLAKELLKSLQFGAEEQPAHGVDSLARDLTPLDWARTALARAICTEAEIVVADEPTADLNEADTATLIDLYQQQLKFNGKQRTMLIITTDESVAEQCTDIIDLR